MCRVEAKQHIRTTYPPRIPGEVVYYGDRCEDGAEVFKQSDRGLEKLGLRLSIRNHSPTGPEWGYLGSGPAQLALALCCEVLTDLLAERCYQQFKTDVIARLPKEGWRMTKGALIEMVLASLSKTTAWPEPDAEEYPDLRVPKKEASQ